MRALEGWAEERYARNRWVRDGSLRPADFIVGAMLCAALLLPRFAWTFSGRELNLVLLITMAGVLLLVVTGQVRISVTRLTLFTIAIAAMLTSTMLGGGVRESVTSFLNLLVVYVGWVFVLPEDAQYERTLRLFRKMALFIAFAGILQFVAQFAIPGPTLFTFETFLPREIISQGFNYVIPVPGMSFLNKSNGFFLLEPSSFSQLMALAILLEIDRFTGRSWRLIPLIAGFLLSFSGTGFVLLAIVLPALLVRRGYGGVLLAFLPILLTVMVFADTPTVSAWLGRLTEFGDEQSSGFARFLSPFYLFNDYLFPKIQTTLFGMGPGAIDPFFKRASYQIHDPTWGKLFFEYGLVGAIPFLLFVCYCFFSGARSFWVSLALFVNYMVLGGYLLDSRLQVLILALVVLQNRPADVPVRRVPPRPEGDPGPRPVDPSRRIEPTLHAQPPLGGAT